MTQLFAPPKPFKLIAPYGDNLMTPKDTEVAYWSALGAGADGIALGVRLTKDNVVVCTGEDTLKTTCDDPRAVSDVTWDELQTLDAGVTFQSTLLDANYQPTGEKGADKPWTGNLAKKAAIRILRLEDVMRLFSRRTNLFMVLPQSPHENMQKLIDETMKVLSQYGMQHRVLWLGMKDECAYLRKQDPRSLLSMVADNKQQALVNIDNAASMSAQALCINIEDISYRSGNTLVFDQAVIEALGDTDLSLHLSSAAMPFCLTPEYYQLAAEHSACIDALLIKGALAAMEVALTPALIACDTFSGKTINRDLWSAGYSHINQDTLIEQNDGIRIHIKGEEGGQYSGAGVVSVFPIHGDFDARVCFHVANPHQGTTFEMAAISVDAGYHHIDNTDLNTRNVNLCFDVHGAPPYASSERDEDDGFRCGWNNGFTLTRILEDWQAASVNMYNKYGRDVGNGAKDNPSGELRLVRHGPVFNMYYRDKYNPAWVCSGSVLVPNLSEDVHIRLAAKHWAKGGITPPANDVTFTNFELYQY